MGLIQPQLPFNMNDATDAQPKRDRSILQKDITKKRHEAVRQRQKELSALRLEGLKPSYQSILEKLAEEFFYDTQTIEYILKKNN